MPLLALTLDDEPLAPARSQSVILLNGDLGKDFPLGSGLRLGGGNFRVVVMHHRGMRSMLRQVAGSRSGDLLEDPGGHHAIVRNVKRFTAQPVGPTGPFMINVDGLRMTGRGAVRVAVTGQIQLIQAINPSIETATEPAVGCG